MTDLLKSTPSWFLVFLVIILGGYFLYSMKQLFKGLSDAIQELKNMIKELFDDRNDHSERLSRLEARCEERHGQRSGVDRRKHTNE